MKTKSIHFLITLILVAFSTSSISALEYTLNFSASGMSTKIDSVVILNITQGTSITVDGEELSAIQTERAADKSLRIYPNPIQGNSSFSFLSAKGGTTFLNVYTMDGKCIVGKVEKLSAGINQFRLALPKGAYVLRIMDNGVMHHAKVISKNASNEAMMQFSGNESAQGAGMQKMPSSSITFNFNVGDLLILKSYAANYQTIVTDIVGSNKSINFNFVECKDADGNDYPVVAIGTQVWMAENLKTSKYRNNSAITNLSNNSTWGTTTSGACADFSSPSANTTYGKLYNWYAATSNNNIAPIGWHVPTDAEWTSLIDYLGGSSVAANKLKEKGNDHWASANAAATNETGFTALPSGSKSTDGVTYDTGNIGYWWSASAGSGLNTGWYRSAAATSATLTRASYTVNAGMALRCIMGDLPILAPTTPASDITVTTAMCGGNVTFDGNMEVTARGICWSTSSSPTVALTTKTTDGTGTGLFTSSITGLTANTSYYVRSYATNAMGTSYSNEISFTTDTKPTLSTTAASSILAFSATSGGTITADGGAQ